MKKHMRIIAAAAACALCLGAVCACGNAVNDKGTNAKEDNGEMTMFLSQEDEWLMLLKDSCAKNAEDNGYYLNEISADGDADAQIKQIKDAAGKGEGAFLVNLVDPSRADEAIKAARNRDIVFINRAPTDLSVLDSKHIYVGSEESEAGELQGQVLAEYCQSEGMKDINYLMLEGPKSLESSRQRSETVLNTLMSTKNFKLNQAAKPIIGNYDRKTAQKQMTALISSGISEKDIDIIISADDAMALGAIDAMKNAGWESLPVTIGVDGLPEAMEAIKDGSMMMTAYQDAGRQGQIAVSAANNLNHGYDYDKDIAAADREDNYIFWVSFQSVTRDNVGQFHKAK